VRVANTSMRGSKQEGKEHAGPRLTIYGNALLQEEDSKLGKKNLKCYVVKKMKKTQYDHELYRELEGTYL